MNHLFKLLLICFAIQILGIVNLKYKIKKLESKEELKQFKLGMNAIITGLIIQFFIIIYQLYLLYFIRLTSHAG